MSIIRSFEDFEAFKVAREFAQRVGKLIRTTAFREERELRWQIEKALISILSNFAEGFERDGRAPPAHHVANLLPQKPDTVDTPRRPSPTRNQKREIRDKER